MKVRVKIRPTGCINGQPWPKVGETIDLPNPTAKGMAEAGHVEIVKSVRTNKTESRPAPAKGVEKRQG